MPTIPYQAPPKGLLVGGATSQDQTPPSQTNLMMAAAMEHQYSMSKGSKGARPNFPAAGRKAKLRVVK